MSLLLKVLLDLIGLSHIHIFKHAETFAAQWFSGLHCHLIAKLFWVQFARSLHVCASFLQVLSLLRLQETSC